MATSLATRRLNWPPRPWRLSERGSWFLNTRGLNVTVFKSRKGWGIKIEQRKGSRCQFGRKRYPTRTEAQRAAFDALVWAEHNWPGNGRYPVAPQGAPT